MNYDKGTQAFKINLQPRSKFIKEIMRLNNSIYLGRLEYSEFTSYINMFEKPYKTKYMFKLFFYYL